MIRRQRMCVCVWQAHDARASPSSEPDRLLAAWALSAQVVRPEKAVSAREIEYKKAARAKAPIVLLFVSHPILHLST